MFNTDVQQWYTDMEILLILIYSETFDELHILSRSEN